MDPSKPVPPSVRLQELLAVPDRDRTEEEWDELIELEITLAPENRARRTGRNDAPGPSGNNAGNNSGNNSGNNAGSNAGNNRRGSKKTGKKRHHKERLPR